MKITLYKIFTCFIFCILSSGLSVGAVYGQNNEQIKDLLSIPLEVSLNSAILFSLNNNPEIEVDWERYNQAKFFAEEGKSDYYPKVSAFVQGGREYADPASNTNPQKNDFNFTASYGVTLEQILFNGFGTLEEKRRRDKLTDAAFWRAQKQIEDVLNATVENYLGVVRYKKETEEVTTLLLDIQQTVQYIQQQYAEGAADKVILDYAKSRLSNARTELRKKQSSLNDAISKLEFLTGKLPPNFAAYYPQELNPDKLDLQYYLNMLEENNSTVIASDYDIVAMQHQLEVQKSGDYPEINFVMSSSQSHNSGGPVGTERDASAVVRMDYSLFDGGANKNAKKRIQSQINELVVKKAQVLKELRRDLKLAYNQVRASASSLETTEEEIRSSSTLKTLNEENFKLGNINVIELIESAERLKTARITKIELTDKLYLNAYKLLISSSIIDQNFFCETC